MREIIFDTETTGLDPKSGHRVVEIGCVEMVHKMRTGNTFHHYINPLRDMPAQAQAVHGISSEFLLDKPVFADIVTDLLAFLGEDSKLVAHNANFDMKFLNYELKTHGHREISFDRVIDTLAVARSQFPGSPASLDALCRRFDVDLSSRNKHGALLDAELLTDVYIELCGGKQVGIDFAEEVATKQSDGDASDAVISLEALAMRPHFASEDELAAHKELIGTINNAIWAKLETA